jgi:hypothetical protein
LSRVTSTPVSSFSQARAAALAAANALATAFAAGGLHSSLNWAPPALIVSTFHLLLISSTWSIGSSLSRSVPP